MDAALEQNVYIDYKCRKGVCGKCKVKLVNGSTNLQPANSLEEKKLHYLIQSGFRLACQAKARWWCVVLFQLLRIKASCEYDDKKARNKTT